MLLFTIFRISACHDRVVILIDLWLRMRQGRRGGFAPRRVGPQLGGGWNPENSLLGAGEGDALSRFQWAALGGAA